MAHKTSDRVFESTSTNGTADFGLSGASTGGFVTFSSICSNGDTFWYCAQNANQDEFEVGYGTYSSAGNTITRPSTVLTNSAGTTAKISFTNNPTVFITIAAHQDGFSTKTGISAAGTIQSDATLLTENFNVVSTVSANTGVKLLGTMPQWVKNNGANTLKVYPQSGGTINANSSNAAETLFVGQSALFRPDSATHIETF